MTDEALPPPAAHQARPDQPPPKPSIPRWTKWFAGIGALIAAVGLAGTLIRLPYYAYSPGAALDLAPRVHVTGAKTYPGSGRVMLLFVRERARVNVWGWLQASLSSNIDLVKEEKITGGVPLRHADEQAACDMTQSKNAARAAALTTLGYKLKLRPGVDVAGFPRGSDRKRTITFPAEKALFPCDQIVAVDGHLITRQEDLSKLIGRYRPGTSVALRIVRNGRTQTVNVPVVEHQGKRIIGIVAAPRFEFPVDISVDTKNISGPSAGLAMALAIIDDLTPGDLTGGKRVAVTGTIAPDGTVGQIGEIQQKGVSAKAAHARIFIVPACGKDAVCSNDLRRLKQRVGEQVDVEPVATLTEALRVLREAGGAPVSATSTSRAASATG